MMPSSLKILCISLCFLLLTTGCGRKESPVPSTGDAPVLEQLTHLTSGNVIKLNIRLAAGSGGLGYQIDQSFIDPYCKCPSDWQRRSEYAPRPDREGKTLTQVYRLRNTSRVYLFRVRAIDAYGHYSAWSKTIQASVDQSILMK